MSTWTPDSRLPWNIDEEKAAKTFPDTGGMSRKTVQHRYKDIYYSTPYHKEWATVPQETILKLEPGNPVLAVERLSLFLQALAGPASLERPAATEFLSGLTLGRKPANEQFAAVAMALDHVLASNGGKACTLTVARTASGFDFERPPRRPLYFRFQKDVAETDVDVPRYPDGLRTDERSWMMDLGLLRAARRIQARAADPPVEIELALESYSIGGDLSVGVEIRDETTLDRLYRERGRDD